MDTVYLDYNATTPLDPVVREAMLPFLEEVWGNPSSVHHIGRRARALLDEGRDKAATVLGCKPSEVTFTSGGTESINTAILGVARLFRERAAISLPPQSSTTPFCIVSNIWSEKRALKSPTCPWTAKEGSTRMRFDVLCDRIPSWFR